MDEEIKKTLGDEMKKFDKLQDFRKNKIVNSERVELELENIESRIAEEINKKAEAGARWGLANERINFLENLKFMLLDMEEKIKNA